MGTTFRGGGEDWAGRAAVLFISREQNEEATAKSTLSRTMDLISPSDNLSSTFVDSRMSCGASACVYSDSANNIGILSNIYKESSEADCDSVENFLLNIPLDSLCGDPFRQHSFRRAKWTKR